MSAKFYAAEHSTIPQAVIDKKVGLYDVNCREDFYRALNKVDPVINCNWTVNILNYEGDDIIQKDHNWHRGPLNFTVEAQVNYI